MPYALLDDSMYDHPKFIGLSDASTALWTRALSWCSRHLTDGRVPFAAVQMLVGGSAAKAKKVCQELVEHELFDVEGDTYVMHNFHRRNPSGEAVKEKRARTSEARSRAGKKGAEARWGNGKPMANASQTDSPVPVPVPPCVDTTKVSRSRDAGPSRDPRVVAAIEELATEDLRNAEAVKRIARPDAYLAACRTERFKDDGPGLETMARLHPEFEPAQLVSTYMADRWLS